MNIESKVSFAVEFSKMDLDRLKEWERIRLAQNLREFFGIREDPQHWKEASASGAAYRSIKDAAIFPNGTEGVRITHKGGDARYSALFYKDGRTFGVTLFAVPMNLNPNDSELKSLQTELSELFSRLAIKRPPAMRGSWLVHEIDLKRPVLQIAIGLGSVPISKGNAVFARASFRDAFLLTLHQLLGRVKNEFSRCGRESCPNIFLRTDKRQKYCSTKCQNLSLVQRFRLKRRKAQKESAGRSRPTGKLQP